MRIEEEAYRPDKRAEFANNVINTKQPPKVPGLSGMRRDA